MPAIGVLIEPYIVADGGVLGVVVVAKVGVVVVLAFGKDDGEGDVGGGEIVACGDGLAIQAYHIGASGETGKIVGARRVGGGEWLMGMPYVVVIEVEVDNDTWDSGFTSILDPVPILV